MVIHDVDQNTIDWLKLHVGIPTASGFDNLVTPEFKIREGEMPRTYLFKKLAEAWRGEPLIELNNFSVEQGLIVEDEARPFFSLETNLRVQQVGFITSDDGRCGCSPDGLIGGDNGLEIKSPAAHTHVKYLLDGKLPKEYAAQVHGSMFVTGRPKWTFMSYRRKFPALILEVPRNEEIMTRISEAVDRFYQLFQDAMEMMQKYNR